MVPIIPSASAGDTNPTTARRKLERICGPQVPPELIVDLDAYRAEVRAEAAEEQRKFVLSDEFVCDDWEAALQVADLIAPETPAAVPAESAGAEQPETEQPRTELEGLRILAETHRDNAYKQGQLAARRLARARSAERKLENLAAEYDDLKAELAKYTGGGR